MNKKIVDKVLNIAMCVSNNNAYSETFIQQQKEKLEGKVFFYYGGVPPAFLEGSSSLVSLTHHYLYKIRDLIKRSDHYSFAERKPLEKSWKKHHIDLIFAQHGVMGAACYPIARQLNIPLLVHFHGADAYNKFYLNKYKQAYQEMFDYATVIIVVSRHMEQQLLNLGAPKHKLLYNPYGPDETFFNVKPQYNAAAFIAVGRFVEKKAPFITLEAFKYVYDKNRKARLIMVGDGPLLNSCKQLVKAWKLEEAVSFCGILSRQEIQQLMQKASVFVQHSVTAENGDREGTPVSVLEASAAALPVIATRHAGISDVVVHEKTGYLVDEFDLNGMGDYMIELAGNPEKCNDLGLEGRKIIQAHFSLTQHLNKLNKAVSRCVSQSDN